MSVIVSDGNGLTLGEFPSIAAAASFMGVSRPAASKAMKFKRVVRGKFVILKGRFPPEILAIAIYKLLFCCFYFDWILTPLGLPTP